MDTATVSPPIDVSAEEWEARVDLAAIYRLVDHYEWSDLLGTHISARVPGAPGNFLINPFGLMWDEITASSLVKIDMDGNILSDTNYDINPAGYTLHSAILMARPEVNYAIHTHTQSGTAIATQTEGLLPITQHALHILAHTGYHEYGGIETNPDERDRIAASLADHEVLILRNHGLITVGKTAGEAFMWMYRAERACRMQLAVQQAGAPLTPISEKVQDETLELNRFLNSEKGYRTIGVNEWPALRRKLDRLDPSYKS